MLLASLAILGALYAMAVAGVPDFGSTTAPVDAIAHALAERAHVGDLPGGVTFDLRGIDTVGEESILFCAVAGCAGLLRQRRRSLADERDDEGEDEPASPLTEEPTETSRALAGTLIGPLLVLGANVVAHGHLTPGGGFQGGIILAGVLVLAAAGGQALSLRGESTWLEAGHAAGTAGFVALAIAALAIGSAALQNVIAKGTLGDLLSAGTIPVSNLAVGLSVAGAFGLVYSELLDRALLREPEER
jgi:multicomponent Na+:H+ antiporter subunit B